MKRGPAGDLLVKYAHPPPRSALYGVVNGAEHGIPAGANVLNILHAMKKSEGEPLALFAVPAHPVQVGHAPAPLNGVVEGPLDQVGRRELKEVLPQLHVVHQGPTVPRVLLNVCHVPPPNGSHCGRNDLLLLQGHVLAVEVGSLHVLVLHAQGDSEIPRKGPHLLHDSVSVPRAQHPAGGPALGQDAEDADGSVVPVLQGDQRRFSLHVSVVLDPSLLQGLHAKTEFRDNQGDGIPHPGLERGPLRGVGYGGQIDLPVLLLRQGEAVLARVVVREQLRPRRARELYRFGFVRLEVLRYREHQDVRGGRVYRYAGHVRMLPVESPAVAHLQVRGIDRDHVPVLGDAKNSRVLAPPLCEFRAKVPPETFLAHWGVRALLVVPRRRHGGVVRRRPRALSPTSVASSRLLVGLPGQDEIDSEGGSPFLLSNSPSSCEHFREKWPER